MRRKRVWLPSRRLLHERGRQASTIATASASDTLPACRHGSMPASKQPSTFHRFPIPATVVWRSSASPIGRVGSSPAAAGSARSRTPARGCRGPGRRCAGRSAHATPSSARAPARAAAGPPGRRARRLPVRRRPALARGPHLPRAGHAGASGWSGRPRSAGRGVAGAFTAVTARPRSRSGQRSRPKRGRVASASGTWPASTGRIRVLPRSGSCRPRARLRGQRELARAGAEAEGEQPVLPRRADHRRPVDLLHREARDTVAGPRRRAPRGSRPRAGRPRPRAPAAPAAALDVEHGLGACQTTCARPGAPARGCPRRSAAAATSRTPGPQAAPGRWRRARRAAPRRRRVAREADHARERELRAAETLDEVAAARDAERLERDELLSRRATRSRPARLREHLLARRSPAISIRLKPRTAHGTAAHG